MKQKFYSLFLIVLLGIIGMQAWAQTPEPTAKWTFDNTEDLMAPQVGSLTMTPCQVGSYSVTPSTLSETGIVSADGPTEGSKALYVPKAAALKVSRAEGAETSTAYTIMMDIKVPDATQYNGLLQMDEVNNNDGDLFTNKNQIGIGSMGYAGNIKDDTWYRVVFTYNEGNPAGSQARLYVNGIKIKEGGANTRHVMAPFGFYLLCDEDGEKREYTHIATAAFWETPLTDEEVSELGGAIPSDVMEIATADNLRSFATAVNNGEDVKGVLTADIDLGGTWEIPIGTSENNFSGTFDGQGHKITGFSATCDVDGGGLFGMTSGAIIKNFSIYGSLTPTNGTGFGVVGYPSGSTISGIHSYLEIEVPASAGTIHHVGGVVGSARGNNTITGCTFHGSMQVGEGNSDNFAGVVAYLGGDKVSFCANYGTVTFVTPGCAAGGIAGYCNNTGSWVQGCLNMGKVNCSDPEANAGNTGAIVGRLRTHDIEKMTGNCWLEGTAAAAGKDAGTVKLETAFCFNEAQYVSGEVCYNLNGDQTLIGWYQTLPADKAPVLDNTHGQVYKNGRLHCNGDPSDDTVFSNENIGTTQDAHNVVDGFCDYCGLFFSDFKLPNADGFYEIANARQLAWFEYKVNTGELTANAILTDDIDFADMMPEGANPEETQIAWTPIGDWGNTRGTASAGYKGHFNGQGHTIKNLNASSKQNFFGLFGVVSSGCLIENFTIYGNYYTIFQYTGSIAAYSRDENPTIRNIHSYVNINNTCAGGRQGGILGGAHVDNANYKTTIENCIYSGTLDGNDAGGSGNYGGIVGYVNNNKANVIDITNCLFDGEVVNNNETPGGCTFGGIVGYNNGGSATIKNCLSLGTVSAAENKYGQFFGALNGNNSTFVNNYYVGSFINGATSGGKAKGDTPVLVDSYTLASGEVTWKLNEEEFLDAVWRQEIDKDDYPQPTSVGAFVYQSPAGYASVSVDKPETFEPFHIDVITNETAFIEDEDLIAYQTLVDKYKETIESWESIDNLNDFLDAYRAGLKIKEAVKSSAANYAAYIKACEAAANYITENKLEGEYTDFLVTYLEDDVDPCNDYPNGSSPYILETCNLNDEEIVAEIAFVDQMLQNAIAGGLTPGTEITRLIINPVFTEGEDKFEGWTKEAGEGATFATGGVQEIMNIARGKDGAFDINQTLKELPNGIYMMALNGLFLDGQDIYSQFYAGQLYLNNTYNYFMTSSEDIIGEDEALDQENCLISDDKQYLVNDEFIGYVPSTFNGCSYAFSADRYQNFCATEVTDSTLTIGMRNLGASETGDWLPFGNMHVYYLGTAEEANKKLAEVLEGFAARAQIIVDFEVSDGFENIDKKPNIYTGLKDSLIWAISAVDEAATGEQKMDLINTFSDLFNKVHACRKAYVAMGKACGPAADLIENLLDCGVISQDEYDEMSIFIYSASGHFVDGDVTTEEALAIADELNIMDRLLPSVDGIYQLSNAKQLQLFAMHVNSGQSESSAVLTDDIDMAQLSATPEEFDLAWTPIGLWGDKSIAYKGHFDGQGHTIKNFTSSSTQDFFGLFGVISTGAVIENFTIYGDIATVYQYTGGVAGYSRDTETVIRNVHSYVNINNSYVGARQGGILGTAQSGKAIVENCTYSGTLDGNDNAGNGNYGGIIGYILNNAAAIAVINNCLFDGQVVNNNPTPGNCTFGGIVGYNNSGTVTIKNCLSIGTVRSTRYSQFFGAINGNNSTFENNYYVGDNVNGQGSGGTVAGPAPVKVTAEQLASGEICFKLNGEQEVPAWYQTLTGDEKDTYPVLDPTHKVVLYDETNGYHNAGEEDPDGINNVNENLNLNNAGIFNLSGQRMSKLQKGINIIGGKKILY